MWCPSSDFRDDYDGDDDDDDGDDDDDDDDDGYDLIPAHYSSDAQSDTDVFDPPSSADDYDNDTKINKQYFLCPLSHYIFCCTTHKK